MKRLYFIRHGQSEGNLSDVISGQLDYPLTSLGRRQAKQAAKESKDLDIDCIVSSPLSRSLKTAKIIAEEINYPLEKIIISDLFMERCYGSLQGKAFSLMAGKNFETHPDIETIPQLVKRAQEALSYIHSLPVNNVLISSHGTFGRALRHQLFNEEIKEIEVTLDNELPNAQIICWI